MSPVATLIVLGLAAGLWFGLLRPRLRGGASKPGGNGGGAVSDGQRDRDDDDAADGDGGDGGGDGGGD